MKREMELKNLTAQLETQKKALWGSEFSRRQTIGGLLEDKDRI